MTHLVPCAPDVWFSAYTPSSLPWNDQSKGAEQFLENIAGELRGSNLLGGEGWTVVIKTTKLRSPLSLPASLMRCAPQPRSTVEASNLRPSSRPSFRVSRCHGPSGMASESSSCLMLEPPQALFPRLTSSLLLTVPSLASGSQETRCWGRGRCATAESKKAETVARRRPVEPCLSVYCPYCSQS
ncbi:hypothetical protein FA95DRAFT_371905 [Auriscalpium vulgare]|uniref:Uncharacterized protein n=1 Tax=Auriscalpium vulgare TaxID=40419 RepID=A0ACB8RHK5_9AGAM|nr:hypothetical protein FA95DRAFT_371905 [Auriscalpium vulgare]